MQRYTRIYEVACESVKCFITFYVQDSFVRTYTLPLVAINCISTPYHIPRYVAMSGDMCPFTNSSGDRMFYSTQLDPWEEDRCTKCRYDIAQTYPYKGKKISPRLYDLQPVVRSELATSRESSKIPCELSFA